ncbi:TPA: right-handed parallel beta-helix repeat-containing protein, partial [Candidatus Micrarchaeota archaeon]|nr:right-handed parallel beta-helix repeat-containing protein [Candidatus Micrarchaeota archaeon]
NIVNGSGASGFYIVGNNGQYYNNTIYGNADHGIYVNADNNVFQNNSIHNNTLYGIYFTAASDNCDLYNATVSGSENGLRVESSTGLDVRDSRFYNNSLADANISAGGIAEQIYLLNVTFDNPYGTYENYTVLYIDDSIDIDSTYSINWSRQNVALPNERVSFHGKFVNISNLAGPTSIDEISWTWSDTESSGYNESNLALWKYNGSHGWTLINDTPNTVDNTLSQFSFSPQSDYAILRWPKIIVGNCMLVNTPGVTAELASDLEGANITAAPYEGQACVKIAANDVILECKGYNISNNGTAGTTFGVLVSSAGGSQYSGITLRNCPNISGYAYGQGIMYSSEINTTNSTIFDNTYNIYLNTSFVNASDLRLYGAGTADLLVNNSAGTDRALNLTGIIFDSSSGGYTNYSRLALDDAVSPNSAYLINWSNQPPSLLNASYSSFAGWFVNISNVTGSVSLDRVIWQWNTSEISSYVDEEAIFELHKYNASGWTIVNGTSDLIGHNLQLFNHEPKSIYGVVFMPEVITNITGCLLIESPGNYDMINNFVGANISASPAGGNACVKIAAPNVRFDC